MFDCLSVNVRSKLTFVQMFSGEHTNNNFSLNTQKNKHHHTGLEGYSWLRNDLRSKTVHDKLQFTLTSSNFWFGVLIKMQTSFISKLKLKQIFKVALTGGKKQTGSWFSRKLMSFEGECKNKLTERDGAMKNKKKRNCC